MYFQSQNPKIRNFFRGLCFALPISLVIWAIIWGLVELGAMGLGALKVIP